MNTASHAPNPYICQFRFMTRSAIFSLAFLMSCSVFAQKAIAVKKGDTYAHIQLAAVQRILPGRPEVPIRKEYYFTLQWKSNTPPVTILSYVDDKWHSCTVEKAEHVAQEKVSIKKNDVIIIHPVEIVQNPIKNYKPANNTVIFKIKNNWFYLSVKKLINKPDIALP